MLQGCVKKNKRKKMMLTLLHLVFTISSNMKFFWIKPIHSCPVHTCSAVDHSILPYHMKFLRHIYLLLSSTLAIFHKFWNKSFYDDSKTFM